MPKVSIAISTCNSAGYLRECLSQLLNQSVISDCEVIVIDSGSDQDEASVCHEFAPRFDRLIYQRTPRETLYAAWNRALEIATGDFFVNANTDDALRPDALDILSRALEENPEAALAYGDWIWAAVPNATFPWDSSFRRIQHEPYHPSLALIYAYAGCHQFWRKSKLQAIGGFNANRVAAGDYEALCRMVRLRFTAVYVPMAISGFYQNPKGLSRSSETSISEFYEIRNAFRADLKISDVFEVAEEDLRACADAWIHLAQRVQEIGVPWAPEPVADRDYAKECALRALAIDPRHGGASAFLKVLNSRESTEPSRSFFGRIFGKWSGPKSSEKPSQEFPSRTSAPVFQP